MYDFGTSKRRMQLCSGEFRQIQPNTFFQPALCSRIFFVQVPKSCTDLNPTLLYVSMLRTYSRFVQKNEMLALGVCFMPERWPQDHHQGQVKITFELLQNIWFVSTRTNSMKCFVNWIPLNMHTFIRTKPNPALKRHALVCGDVFVVGKGGD